MRPRAADRQKTVENLPPAWYTGTRNERTREATTLRTKRRILLVLSLVWLAVIFGHSCMPAAQSDAESTAVLWGLDRFFPFLTHHMVRKLAHFAEFFILGSLLAGEFACLSRASRTAPLLCGLLCALTDETIQLYVPGRSGQLSDVWLDFSGVAAAVVLAALLARLLRRRRHKC